MINLLETQKKFNLSILLIILSGFAGIITSFLSLFRAGIGWDATYDTSTSIYVRSVPSGSTIEEAYDFVPTVLEFYGVLIPFFADMLHGFFYDSKDFLSPYSSTTYLWQGSINILIAALAAAGLSYSIYIATSSLITAAAIWGLLNTLPIWLGMSHVNFKDMPVAAGLTLISSGLMLSLIQESNLKRNFFSLSFILFGTFLAVGTRAGSIILILVIILGSEVIYFLFYLLQKKSFQTYFIQFTLVSIMTALGVSAVRLINPVAKIDTFRWLLDAINLVSSFPFNMPQRVAGRDYSSLEVPWWYAPAWFLAQTPLLLLIILLSGSLLFIYLFFFSSNKKIFVKLFLFTPIVIQGIVLPVAISLSDAVLYDAVRHLLFVWPALIIFVVFFTKFIVKYFIKNKDLSHYIFTYTIVLLIIFNLFASLRWVPYSYAFINPVAGYESNKRNWDLDYWGVSAREGIERLKNDTNFNEVYVMPDISSSIPYGGINVPSNDLAQINSPHGLYVFIRWNHKILPEKCDILFEIKRDRQTLGMGGVCPKGFTPNAD